MSRRGTMATVGVVWGALALLGAASAAGLHVNRTVSMPAGLWRAHRYTRTVVDGDAVVVCLRMDDTVRRYIGPGPCPNGLEPLLKTVGAVPGDTVVLTVAGAVVNGRAIPRTAALARDEAGRVLVAYPPGTYQVKPGQIFLFSSHDAKSFDSRYFGPIASTAIIAKATPVLTSN